MGRKRHGGWDGYDEIRDKKGVISHAKCRKCSSYLSRRDEATLIRHKEICIGPRPQYEDENLSTSNHIEHMDIDLPDQNTFNQEALKHRHTNAQVTVFSPEYRIQERNTAVLKFFLLHGFEFNETNLCSCADLLRLFDPGFQIPSLEDLKGEITSKATNTVVRRSKAKNHLKVIALKICENNGIVFCLALLCNEDVSGEPSFIDSIFINKTETMDTVETDLNTFCDLVVQKAYTLYNTSVKFLLHEGIYDLKIRGKVNVGLNKKFTIEYITVHEINFIINKLKTVRLSISLNSLSQFSSFHDSLNALESEISLQKDKMFEAVEKLLIFLNSSQIFNDQTYASVLGEQLRLNIENVYLACNYLHPNYRGRMFSNYSTLFEKLESFLKYAVPQTAFNALGHYIFQEEFFKIVYADKFDEDYLQFWSIVKKKYPSFSEYALDLLNIPGTTYQIDVKKVYDLFLKYSDDSFSFRSLLFSVFIKYHM